MANIDLYKQKLVNIGSAIREKLKETTQYTLEEMPDKIRSISGGSSIKIVETYSKLWIPKNISATVYSIFPKTVIKNGYSKKTVSKV